MRPSGKTRRYYPACLLARTAAFLTLTAYAFLCPDAFLAELSGSPFRLSLLTVIWLLLMAIPGALTTSACLLAAVIFLRW